MCVALFFARLSFGGRIDGGDRKVSSRLLFDDLKSASRFFLPTM